MTSTAFQLLFQRDLSKLKQEIQSYNHEEKLWSIDKNIVNSGGNLCLHLIGNLNAYIGVGLAKTDYVRYRDLEFSSKNIPRQSLLQQIDETMIVVDRGLMTLTSDHLVADFPIIIWDHPTRMDWTLMHLYGHLNYHLGQINYHRRLMDVES